MGLNLNNLENLSIFSDGNDPIWPISKWEIRRNLSRYHFPNKLERKEKEEIITLIHSAVEKTGLLSDPIFLFAKDLSSEDKQKLYEHFLIASDICDSKPGIGFIIDTKNNILISINVTNHLTIQKIDQANIEQEHFNQIVKLESALNQLLGFAYNEAFGYLTSDPRLSGTGLSIEAYLHIPGTLFINREAGLTELINHSSNAGGIDEDASFLGNIAVIRNRYCIGVSEEQIIKSTHASAMKLQQEEKSNQISLQGNSKIKDRVSRSFALLKHSYEIDPSEAINALSDLLLGNQLKWIEGLDRASLIKLFFEMRRSQIMIKDASEEELAHQRAKQIHPLLEKIQLTI